MIWSMLMFCALIHEDPTTAVIAPTDLSAYESARTKAGRDADAHVRLALWCESHGMGAERMKHLAMAVLYSPSHGLARGLMGLVACQGKWERPEIVGRRIEDDPAYRERIREYLELRSSTPRKPDAQARLAAWCEEKGLKEQSIAHYNEVVRLDPSREAAWKHLGYKKQGSRWVKPEDLAAERSESERQRHADKQWEPKLKRLREGLESKDSARCARAEAAIADVTDPRAVPMIWAVLFRGGERARLAAVQMLGQIDGPSASNALAALVLYNPSARVRARAAQSLNRRDPRDIVGRLVNLLRKPFKYEVKRVGGPGTVGELFLEGERFNIRRFYENRVLNPDALGMIGDRLFAPSVPFDPYSVQNQWMLFAANQGLLDAASLGGSAAGGATASHPQDAAAMLKNRGATLPGAASNPAVSMINDAYVQALYRDRRIATAYQLIDQSRQNLEQTLALDIQTVETTNTQISEINSRILPVLQTITGQNMGIEPEQWKAWWTDQLGYAYQSSTSETKRTYSEWVVGTTGFSQACFAAGTTVSTLDGPRDRIDPGRRPRPGARYHDRLDGLPAGPRRAPQQARSHTPHGHRRRDDRHDRHPPILEGGQGLDHGPRPQAGRLDPRDRRRRGGEVGRRRRHRAGLQPRRRREPGLLRRHQGLPRPRLQLRPPGHVTVRRFRIGCCSLGIAHCS